MSWTPDRRVRYYNQQQLFKSADRNLKLEAGNQAKLLFKNYNYHTLKGLASQNFIEQKASRSPKQIEFMGNTFTFGSNLLRNYSEINKKDSESQ